MDENRNHFKIKAVFPKLKSEGNTIRVDISIDLNEHILTDKKVKDSAIWSDLTNSKSYSIKSLWGMPKTYYKIIKALNKSNVNCSIGYEIPLDFEQADTEADDE